jgi:hypothetical protein
MILAMQHNRNVICPGVERCLIHRFVNAQSLSSLNLKMHTVEIGNDVFAFQPRELLPTSSSNPQSFVDGFCRL